MYDRRYIHYTNSVKTLRPPKTVVLLDFDGVVLQNKRAHNYVTRKIEKLVQDVTGEKDIEHVKQMNKELYTQYGHTLLGLQHMGYNITLDDFNDYVYGNVESYRHFTFSEKEIIDVCTMIMRSKRMNTDIMLFSNADVLWLTNFLRWDPTLYAIQDIVDDFGVLKPQRDCYDLVNTYLKEKLEYDSIYFVDDSKKNIEAAPESWVKILFNNNTQMTKIGDDNVIYCDDLRDVLKPESKTRLSK